MGVTITCICESCKKEFAQYGDAEPQTLSVRHCESGGIYGIEVTCPHCQHVHDIQ